MRMGYSSSTGGVMLVFIVLVGVFGLRSAQSNTTNTVQQQHHNHNHHHHNHAHGHSHGHNNSKIKPHEIWAEVNETILLNCSLRINKEHHVSI